MLFLVVTQLYLQIHVAHVKYTPSWVQQSTHILQHQTVSTFSDTMCYIDYTVKDKLSIAIKILCSETLDKSLFSLAKF